ncbi:MAG: VacJ family lipoprotein [Pseudomonadota bacterium]
MRNLMAAAAAAAMTTGCATTSQTAEDEIYDPYEGFNRGVFAFNNTVDDILIVPLAKGYRAVTPEPARDGVSNALSNLNSPVVIINSVLQGDPQNASTSFFRFMINSTVGIGGLFDVAERFGLERRSEDFGQTLGVWGVSEGPYIIIPFLGPGNLRDGVGRGADTVMDPLTWIEFANNDLDTIIQWSRTGLTVLSAREQFLEQFDALRSQPEPYIALRRAYTLQRRAAVRNGEVENQEDPFSDLPDFDDFDDFDDEESFEE